MDQFAPLLGDCSVIVCLWALWCYMTRKYLKSREQIDIEVFDTLRLLHRRITKLEKTKQDD